MESKSNQYSRTLQLHHILHTICLCCIRWWDCVGWLFKEAYRHFTTQIIIVHPHSHHLTAQNLLTLYAALYGPDDTPESGISSSLWCSVSSSDHARLTFGPLLRAGGDHSLCYHNHLVQCSRARCVELCFAQVGQPVQMPGAVFRGFLIPIINTIFIELSTTAYLFSLSLLVLSQDSTSWLTCPRATDVEPSPGTVAYINID
jgi:hypothetical protein